MNPPSHLLSEMAHLLNQHVYDRRIGEGTGIAESFHFIRSNFAQNSPHNLATSSHWQRWSGADDIRGRKGTNRSTNRISKLLDEII